MALNEKQIITSLKSKYSQPLDRAVLSRNFLHCTTDIHEHFTVKDLNAQYILLLQLIKL